MAVFFHDILNEYLKNKKILFKKKKKKIDFKINKYDFLIISFKMTNFLKVIIFLLRRKIKFKKNFFFIYKQKNFLQGKYLFPVWKEGNKNLFFLNLLNWLKNFFFLKNLKGIKFIIIALKKNDF